VTVSNVQTRHYRVSYNESTHVLSVTGTNLVRTSAPPTNHRQHTDFTGQGGATYT